MKAYHPPKFTAQMQAALNGAVIERRYTGQHKETLKNYGEWHILVCNTGTYGVLRELISEFRGWEYRIRVPDGITQFALSDVLHGHCWAPNAVLPQEWKLRITYEGSSNVVKDVEVLK